MIQRIRGSGGYLVAVFASFLVVLATQAALAAEGRTPETADLDELEALWQRAKAGEA